MTKRSSPAGKKFTPAASPSTTAILNQPDGLVEYSRLLDENRRLTKSIEARAAELDIINSVQEGLVSKKNIQAIYELVGEKIREVFDAQGIDLTYFDEVNELVIFHYSYEKGKRLEVKPVPFTDRVRYFMRTKHPIVVRENLSDYITKLTGSPPIVHAGELPKSMIMMPLIISDQAKGFIAINNIDRENAFSDSDVRLLTSLARSTSIALENARLFDEVQKKNAEITESLERETASNDILQVIAESPTNLQPVLDVIAENARRLCDGVYAVVCRTDGQMVYEVAATDLSDDWLETAREVSTQVYPVRLSYDSSLSSRAILSRAIVHVPDMEHASDLPESTRLWVDARILKSILFTPMLREGEAIGAIGVGRREALPFTERQMTLLQTFASQAVIAIENVRLFDETQRLLKETEQRNVELAIINSVQATLSAKLDLQGIYDAVGDKIRSLFGAQIILIMAFDPVARTRQVKYYGEYGQRLTNSPGPLPFDKLAEHLVATRETLVFNHDLDARITEFGVTVIEGTMKPKSAVFVPQISGGEVRGLISLQNVEKENAFIESDINLLSTFAAAMSVALENARLYAEQVRMVEELETVNKMRSRFVSSMSHELRTPLNIIINFNEILHQGILGPVNEQQEVLLNHSLQSSRHLLNLINDVLDINKIQAGRLTLFMEDNVDLREELDVVLNLVNGLAQGKNLQLFNEIDADLPRVSCDRRRIRQVLLNLLGNAIKFTKAGSVTLVVRKPEDVIQFEILDTGPGVAPAIRDMIFDPFVQSENTDGLMEGTGLGLPISRSLVRAHGGDLWLERTSEDGSSFIFTLPINGKKSHG